MRSAFAVAVGTLLASFTMAYPAHLAERQNLVCSGTSPYCCDVNVLGIADLDCETPPTVPTTTANFTAICAAVGKIDMCCYLDLLDQGLLCNAPA